MTDKNIGTAKAYYQAMGNKDLSALERCLHPKVEFSAPLAKTEGREALLEGAKRFFAAYDTLTICDVCGNGEKAMVVYELLCPEPIGSARAVALMSFQDALISSVELFYDARPFLR
ncbi:MAG: hypothetical protein SP1CHLAM54_16880 [Chlamydiia bacterium]|nr:hypothetical protein [Chlamydiia bacterium]MCH9616576.1 hypothetical protein [Chlamydiia bacterium]MCH9629306.1 hypothetical protein [Chlamydiia bacterium]